MQPFFGEGIDGMDTFVNRAMEQAAAYCVDAEANGRIYVAEVMGRDAGFLTYFLFEASSACVALIPELKNDDEPNIDALVRFLQDMDQYDLAGRKYGLILVSEGLKGDFPKRVAEATHGYRKILTEAPEAPTEFLDLFLPQIKFDDYGNPKLGGIGRALAYYLNSRLPKDTVQEVPAIGYQYRCAAPSMRDIQIATRTASFAFTELMRGRSGFLAAFNSDRTIKPVDLQAVVKAGTVGLKPGEYEPHLHPGNFLVK